MKDTYISDYKYDSDLKSNTQGRDNGSIVRPN